MSSSDPQSAPGAAPLIVRTVSVAGTRALAAAVAGVVVAGDTVVLAGEMGVGKTAFAQGFGAALGVGDPITSPTFNLVHSHELPVHSGRAVRAFHHADLYRLGTRHDVDDLGLAELAEDAGVVLVEWGDVVADAFGDHLQILIARPAHDVAGDERVISIEAVGASWAARIDALRAAVRALAADAAASTVTVVEGSDPRAVAP